MVSTEDGLPPKHRSQGDETSKKAAWLIRATVPWAVARALCGLPPLPPVFLPYFSCPPHPGVLPASSLTSKATHQHNTDPFCQPGLCSSLSRPGMAARAVAFPGWDWPQAGLPEEMLVTTRWGAGACGAQQELEPHTRCSCGINGDTGGQGNTDTACTHCPGDKLKLTRV